MRKAFLCTILAILLATTASPAAQTSYDWPENSVLPVFFVPTDWPVTSAEVLDETAAIRTAMAELQEYYGNNLGGRAFRFSELEVVQAWGPKEDYEISWNGGNIYTDGIDIVGNLEHEVVNELHQRGYPTPPAQNENGYSVLVFVKGAGGYAGGRELGGGDGGWAILGDWCIDSLQGDVLEGQYWWSGRRLQLGAAAHELGHSFGLPHPDAWGGGFHETIMGNWWEYPTIGFASWDENHLFSFKDHFFTTMLLSVPTLTPGASINLYLSDAAPSSQAWLAWSAVGLDQFQIDPLNIALGLAAPQVQAAVITDTNGDAAWPVQIPFAATGMNLWLQVVQLENSSQPLAVHVQ